MQSRLAEGLLRAALAILAVMPVGMAIAHRSSPVFVVLSALCALGAAVVEGRLRAVVHEAFAALRSPVGLAVLAFFSWCLVSIGWSEFKLVSLRAFGEFWLSVIAAFALGLTLAGRVTRQAFWLLAGAFALACVLIVFEIATGLAFRHNLGIQAYGFIFNRSVLTLLVLALPLVVWFVGQVRHGWIWSLGLLLLFSLTAFVSDSGAVKLGLMAAGLVFSAAWFMPGLARAVIAAVLAVAMLIAPWIGSIGSQFVSSSMHQALAEGHSRERIALWTSFGAAVEVQPVVGAGFGVSPRMQETTVAKEVPRNERRMLAIGHPHNAALQIWVELGAIGVAIALIIVLLVLRAVARQPRLLGSASLALIAGSAAVALVGHGAWQGWWAASLGASMIWMLAADRIRPETAP